MAVATVTVKARVDHQALEMVKALAFKNIIDFGLATCLAYRCIELQIGSGPWERIKP